MLRVARTHLRRLAPELADAPLHLHQLDGPPGAPRYSVSVELCESVANCPYKVTDPKKCPIFACGERRSLRLLLTREGELVQAISDDLNWDS